MKKLTVSVIATALSLSVISPSLTSAAEISKLTTHNMNTASLTKVASTGGYQYVTTFRTKKSVYTNTGALGISAAGLVGGPAGVIATIASVLVGLKTYSDKEVYIEIVQYYNPGTHMIKNTYNYYKNSNYTGLITTQTVEKPFFS